MKILAVVITSPEYSVSGAVTAAINLSKFSSALCDIELAIMSNNNLEEKAENLVIKNFKCTNFLPKFLRNFSSQITNSFWRTDIDLYIEKSKPDIVHFHNPVPPLALWKLAKLCLKKKIPYVISSHGFVEMFDYKNAFNINFIKSLFLKLFVLRPFYKTIKNASAIFLLSPPEKEVLMKNLTYKGLIEFIPNGYDNFYLKKPSLEIQKTVRKKFKLNNDLTKFLFLGNHTHNKGIDIILNSLKYIQKDCQVIIGGKIRSIEEHASLLKKTKLLANESRFIFTDFLTKEEILSLLFISDCFIFPSRADTFPLVILEAMAAEVPVISTSIGGIPYQVGENCGVLIKPNSPEELSIAMSRLINKKDELKEFGKNARKRVLSNFSWENSAKTAIDSYNKILAMKI